MFKFQCFSETGFLSVSVSLNALGLGKIVQWACKSKEEENIMTISTDKKAATLTCP